MQEEPNKRVNVTNAREKMLQGVELGYQAVSSTFGPRSANVAIGRPYGAPAVIHDGVNTFRSLFPMEDKEAEVGAAIAYEASNDTNQSAGDGTTLATVLIREIATKAHKFITAGARPMALREGIELATQVVLDELDKQATAIDVKKDADKILMIATISAQVPDIGQMVADAYKQLGAEAILTVEESKSTDSSLELKEGMQFDKGWLTPYFITDDKLKEAIITNPHILVTDMDMRDLEDFSQMMIRLVDQAKVKDIVIIANSFELPIVAYFVKNHLSHVYNGLLIQAPAFGDKRIDILKDIAITTGAQFVSESAGIGLQSVTQESLGHATRITSTSEATLIVEGTGSKEDVDGRVAQIKQELTNTDLGEYDREKLMERLARLHSGVGVLTIGARSEPEMKERRERAIDAKSAAKAALVEGIVPGGGIALKTAATAARKFIEKEYLKQEFDVHSGIEIILEACEAPFSKLLSNAGYDPGEYKSRLSGKGKGYGVDVMDGQIVPMIEAGIIDPVLVIKSALGHASSAAMALSTSNTLVTPILNNSVKENQ